MERWSQCAGGREARAGSQGSPRQLWRSETSKVKATSGTGNLLGHHEDDSKKKMETADPGRERCRNLKGDLAREGQVPTPSLAGGPRWTR